ncbi:MAG TPA: CPBP family glutamic-type intramembrane protease [Gemmatimonadales bacterium]
MSYFASARAPRYSVLFALPLLLAYEVLAWALGRTGQVGVRNGADVLLKSLFLTLGGRHGLTLFSLLLMGGGAVLVVRDLRRNGTPRPAVYGGMLAESVAYALLLGTVAGLLTSFLLTGRLALVAGAALQGLGLPTQIMISLGAGIYEELLFRVVVVAGLALLARRGFGWRPVPAGVFAAVLGALIFSGFHYVGPYGDRLEIGSFTFRTIAGLLFSGLYLTRGFGITAWSHALYDVFLAVT